MSETVWAWLMAIASGIAGLRWAWTWALLEAIVLPLPPDLLLIPLAIARPDRTLAFAGVAIFGSVMGGCVTFLLGRLFGTRAAALLTKLPGVGEGRILLAASRLKRFGARFIACSPWLVLPYKISSLLGGQLRIPWWNYLLASTIGRGTRLTMVTLAAAGIARMSAQWGQAPVLVTIFSAYAVIGFMIWLVRRWLWERFSA